MQTFKIVTSVPTLVTYVVSAESEDDAIHEISVGRVTPQSVVVDINGGEEVISISNS